MGTQWPGGEEKTEENGGFGGKQSDGRFGGKRSGAAYRLPSFARQHSRASLVAVFCPI